MKSFQPGIDDLGFVPDLVLVVSDLHIGVGQDPVTFKYEPRENFFADEQFGAMLEKHDPAKVGSALLVLNGDIWDFLRIPEIPETDEDFAEWKTALHDLG